MNKVPLAASGTWVAAAHHASMIAPEDVCVLFNVANGVAFRAGSGAVELRVTNPNWTLPTGVEGDIVVTIGDWKATFSIDENTANMVNAEINSDLVVSLLNATDRARTMSIAVGKAKPIQVSLAGSSRAANAFRTCAGIENSEKQQGENPFQ